MSGGYRTPWAADPPPAPASPPADEPTPRPKPRGRRPAAVRAGTAATGPDWRYHHLTITGPAPTIETFAAAACGSGIIPWQLDFSNVEATVFTLAITQPAARRSLTVDGCRILARQFRQRVERHQAVAAALSETSRACPFDLQALLPVPLALLAGGPDDPAARRWLATHWGTTDRLRQVVIRDKPGTGRRLPAGHTAIGYGFFTDGETPHAAIATLAAAWPSLRFALVPRPAS